MKVYREGEIIAEVFDQSPLEINYISFGTVDSSGMRFFYNCGNKDADFENDEPVPVSSSAMTEESDASSETAFNETEVVTANAPAVAKINWLSMSSATSKIPIALKFNILIMILFIL